jgi:hypothetical protein
MRRGTWFLGLAVTGLLALGPSSACGLIAECQDDFDCGPKEICARDKTCQALPEDTAQNGASVAGVRAEISIATINGIEPSDTDPPIAPLDDLRLTGEKSISPTGSFTSITWTFLSRPPESSMEFTNPSDMETGFVFSSAAGDVNGVDVAGHYEIQLEVKAGSGEDFTDTDTFSFDAVPGDDLHLQLTWDVPTGDVDMHFRRVGVDPYFGPSSCYFGTCTGTPPDWDGDGTESSAGDPSLDIDDTNGFGPENINILNPQDGEYEVGVHYWRSDGDPTTATLKIYDKGSLKFDQTRLLSNTDDSWRVAKIAWGNGEAAVTPIDEFYEQTQLGNIQGQVGMTCAVDTDCMDPVSCTGEPPVCQ